MSSESTSTHSEGNNEETAELVTPVPSFLVTLWKIINDSNAEHIIGWNSRGNGFIIYDGLKFVSELLPKYFKNRYFSSFIRQLHFYDFYKVTNNEYAHSHLNKGSPESLVLIARQTKNDISKTNHRQENEKKKVKGGKEDTEETMQIVIPEQIPKTIPMFLQNLWKIVNDADTELIIGWNSTDDGFIIYDQGKFVTELLPQYFIHNNLSSFITQLNVYDFYKVDNNKHEMEFEHSCFLRGSPETLALITDKRDVKSITTQEQEIKKPNKILNESIEEALDKAITLQSMLSTSTSAPDDKNVEEPISVVIHKQKAKSVTLFIQKLWNIVNDPNTDHIIGWNSIGNGIIIFDQVKLLTELLPKHFQHNNLSSFIRALNIYKFHRVIKIEPQMEFAQSYFLKGLPELLPLVTRKHGKSKKKQKEEKYEKVREIVIPEQKAAHIPVFLQKLWKMVNDPNVEHIIGWNSTGNGFIIYDQEKVKDLLSQYFKHNNLSSFMKQLKAYSFHRVDSIEHEMEFENSYFLKGSHESLVHIARNTIDKSITNEKSENVNKHIKGVNENIEEAMETVPEQKIKCIPLFLRKLWKMVNDPNMENIISWNSTGSGFVIYDQIKVTEVLSQYYKHNNLASFIRMLHIYDFHKVPKLNTYEIEYEHPYFHKGSPEKLVFIINKRSFKSVTNQTEEIAKKRMKVVKENMEETIEMISPVLSVSSTCTSTPAEESSEETAEVITPKQKTAPIPLFLKILWKIVNDPNTEDIIGWNSTGDGFVVHDQEKVIELLPQYFKHNNLTSFIRQLNLYDFHKVIDDYNGFQFTHSCFLKGFPESLAFITRKVTNTQSSTNHKESVKKLIKHVKEMKNKLSSIDNELETLIQENTELWSEISSLHLKYSKMS